MLIKKVIYIWGEDSAGVAGMDVVTRADEKVFKKDNMLFGFTSSFRMGQIIRHCFKIPDRDPRTDVDTYLCRDFVSGLIDSFKEYGYNGKDKVGRYKDGIFFARICRQLI